MENKDLAQKNLENGQKNFFFDHVKNVIAEKRAANTFEKELNDVLNCVKNDKSFDTKQYEIMGIMSFLTGIDYVSMAYPQKAVLENVQKRFEDVEITKENLEVYKNILIELSEKDIHTFIDSPIEFYKDAVTKEIEVTNENKVALKLLKSKLNKFIDGSIIPIQFASGVVDLKRNNLTWENLLKFNSLLNEQAIYTGFSVKKFIEVYSDPFFNNLLKLAGDIFNATKFAIVYEESIVSAVESVSRFKPVFNPDEYSDEEYSKFESEYTEKREKELEEYRKQQEENPDAYKPLKYTGEQVKQLMTEVPDEFVVLNLLESGKFNSFKDTDSIITSIEAITKNTDFIQHIYQYLRANISNPNRQKYVKAFDGIENEDVVKALSDKIKSLGETYKELAEINCAEIPEEQHERIVNMVNDTIKACYLQSNEQKQYLISQIVENGITTWNHLQQIISIIETCNINGSDSDTYNNLINFIKEKSNITEVFENAEKLNDIQVEIKVFTAYRDWFKYLTDIDDMVKKELNEETEQNSEEKA